MERFFFRMLWFEKWVLGGGCRGCILLMVMYVNLSCRIVNINFGYSFYLIFWYFVVFDKNWVYLIFIVFE